MNPLPRHVGPKERLAEVCDQLALGLIRPHDRQSSHLSVKSGARLAQ